MKQGVEGMPREREGSNMSHHLESQYAQNKVLSNLIALPNLDPNTTQGPMDAIFKVAYDKKAESKRSE